MKSHLSIMAALALTLCGCDAQRNIPVETTAEPAAAAPPSDAPAAQLSPASRDPVGGGSLVVQLPAAGTITFEGFGPAPFGASDEQVRMAWGGDLGHPAPSEPGGCYYLVPQPPSIDGYKIAFMIEGDKFVRVDVQRTEDIIAPGGGKIGLGIDEIESLYPGHVQQQPHKYVAGGKNLRITDSGSDGVLIFETGQDDKVTAWRIGVPPQVDYVEGCS